MYAFIEDIYAYEMRAADFAIGCLAGMPPYAYLF